MRRAPFLIARYYFLTTLSPAAGLWDWLPTAPPLRGKRPRGRADRTERPPRSVAVLDIAPSARPR